MDFSKLSEEEKLHEVKRIQVELEKLNRLPAAPEIVYHYTNFNKFISIIGSKSFWLSDASMMNDSHEIIWIDRLIYKVAQEKVTSENKERLNNLLQAVKSSRAKAYIFCFSEKRDLLSQWRGYTDDAAGISVGFSTKAFGLDVRMPVTSFNLVNNKSLACCYYDESEIIMKIEAIIDSYLSNTNSLAINYLVQLSYICKNHTFSSEKEWRMVYVPWIFKLQDDSRDIMDLNADIKFRSNGNDLIEYSEHELEISSELIPEIVLGPKCSVDIDTLEYFLVKNNLKNTEIRKSDSTYR